MFLRLLATFVITALGFLLWRLDTLSDEFLDILVGDGWLIASVLLVNLRLVGSQRDLQHGDDTLERKLVQALVERLELISDDDVADLVHLMQAFDTVLDQLGQVDGGLHSVRHALDDDRVVLRLAFLWLVQ